MRLWPGAGSWAGVYCSLTEVLIPGVCDGHHLRMLPLSNTIITPFYRWGSWGYTASREGPMGSPGSPSPVSGLDFYVTSRSWGTLKGPCLLRGMNTWIKRSNEVIRLAYIKNDVHWSFVFFFKCVEALRNCTIQAIRLASKNKFPSGNVLLPVIHFIDIDLHFIDIIDTDL